MRVLLLAEQLRRRASGGIGTYARGLITGLAQAAPATVDVEVFASRARRRRDPLLDLGLPVRTSPLPHLLLTRAWDHGTVGTPRGYDVVHATSLAAPRGDVMVVTVHDLAWRTAPETFPERGRRWHDAALRRAIESASAFVVPSAETAETLADVHGSGRIEVIEHGSDHLPAADDKATDALLHRLGIAGPYLLAVGTLEPRKNLARLVSAYKSVRSSLPEPWPLVLVGAAGWGQVGAMPRGVVVAGEVEPEVVAGLYVRARCVAYVPLVEGYGLPAVEAMRAGIPTVTSRVPAAAQASLLVDPLDVASIAQGLLAVATDEGLREALIAAGRERTEGLTWARSAEAHVLLWRNLA